MSGLAGWIDFSHDLSDAEAVLHAMTETMVQRGPDGKGMWVSRRAAIGHRTLATSRKAAAEQPVVISVGGERVACACAGDLYNTRELLREIESAGGAVRTGSAGELLVQAYILWGDSFIEKVNGVFGFAIWDGRSRALVLGRDRIGVRPLYYFAYQDGVIFASEPKGIMANPRFQARLDVGMLPIALQNRTGTPSRRPPGTCGNCWMTPSAGNWT